MLRNLNLRRTALVAAGVCTGLSVGGYWARTKLEASVTRQVKMDLWKPSRAEDYILPSAAWPRLLDAGIRSKSEAASLFALIARVPGRFDAIHWLTAAVKTGDIDTVATILRKTRDTYGKCGLAYEDDRSRRLFHIAAQTPAIYDKIVVWLRPPIGQRIADDVAENQDEPLLKRLLYHAGNDEAAWQPVMLDSIRYAVTRGHPVENVEWLMNRQVSATMRDRVAQELNIAVQELISGQPDPIALERAFSIFKRLPLSKKTKAEFHEAWIDVAIRARCKESILDMVCDNVDPNCLTLPQFLHLMRSGSR